MRCGGVGSATEGGCTQQRQTLVTLWGTPPSFFQASVAPNPLGAQPTDPHKRVSTPFSSITAPHHSSDCGFPSKNPMPSVFAQRFGPGVLVEVSPAQRFWQSGWGRESWRGRGWANPTQLSPEPQKGPRTRGGHLKKPSARPRKGGRAKGEKIGLVEPHTTSVQESS